MNSAREVLALKYRPKRFEDLIGQDTISVTLSLALDTNRLSHAYLFSGLRGSGKTSTARIMAKALVCEQAPTSKPCEQCAGCIAANENRHLDIIEMDAASNRGIDDIKDLIEHTKYKPTSAKYKVFIIDEVHMLTTQAFNALLKTLEEPPSFVKFILATTDPLKLPATILSRTQHFRFKRISDLDIMHHLSHILNIEDIKYEKEALNILTRNGNGSLRDTLTLLDQAIIFSKGIITTSSVTDMLGMIDLAFLDNMFNIILHKGDIKQLVESLQSYETGQVLDEISIYLKEQMLGQNSKFPLYVFDRFFRILADAKQLLNLNSDNSFVLILTLLKMVEAVNLKTIDEIIMQIDKKKVINIEDNITKEQSKEEANHIIKEHLTPKNIEVEQKKDNAESLFAKLIDELFYNHYELGECFKKSFIFSSFKNNVLFIDSIAEGECKKLLYKNFSYIKQFINKIYGDEIEIEFNKIKQTNTKDIARIIQPTIEIGSMIEDIEFTQSSSCVGALCNIENPTLAQVEIEPNQILNSKMLKTAITLFQPVEEPIVKSKL